MCRQKSSSLNDERRSQLQQDDNRLSGSSHLSKTHSPDGLTDSEQQNPQRSGDEQKSKSPEDQERLAATTMRSTVHWASPVYMMSLNGVSASLSLSLSKLFCFFFSIFSPPTDQKNYTEEQESHTAHTHTHHMSACGRWEDSKHESVLLFCWKGVLNGECWVVPLFCSVLFLFIFSLNSFAAAPSLTESLVLVHVMWCRYNIHILYS